MRAGFLVLAGLAQVASAQSLPNLARDDLRIATVQIMQGQTQVISSPSGADLTVLMPPGEHVQDLVVGDPSSWHVSLSPAKDALTAYSLHSHDETDLFVRTDLQSYRFRLVGSSTGQAPYVVRIVNGGTAKDQRASSASEVDPRGISYKLSGDRGLMPTSVRDDGQKTYIEWAPTQAIPAVFAVTPRGTEEMIDGYMRKGRFVLDRVYDELVFRIDRVNARARRLVKGRRR